MKAGGIKFQKLFAQTFRNYLAELDEWNKEEVYDRFKVHARIVIKLWPYQRVAGDPNSTTYAEEN